MAFIAVWLRKVMPCQYTTILSAIDDRFLFQGSSCFPLSPCDEMKESQDKEVNIVSQND